MRLYKNVDVCDLESILEKGILSLEESGNNNWADGKRAPNSTDVVYLFKPKKQGNAFPKYGLVLLEVEVDATQNDFLITDPNADLYDEYIVDKVKPEEITKIIIPKIFKNKITLRKDIEERVIWCDMSAAHYTDDGKVEANEDVLKRFAETAHVECAEEFNFFRGIDDNNHMIDLYDIEYKF